MADNNITTSLNLDVSGLKAGISEANKQIKLANAEFKAATAGMDDWSSSAEGLKAKLTQLDSVLSAQKNKLSAYEKQLEAVEGDSAKNKERADELRKKLQELANNGVSKATPEFKELEKELAAVEKEQADNEKSADDLKLKILNQKAAVAQTEKEMRNYQKSLDAVDKEDGDVSKSSDKVRKGVKDVGGAADESGKKVNTFGDFLKANLTSQAIISGVKKLSKGLKDLAFNALELSDDLATQSTQTGLSTEKLQEMYYAADLLDTPVETVTGSLKKLTKKMSDARNGSDKATEAFDKLGVKVTDNDGKLRDSEEVFYDIIEALGGIDDETERDAASMEIFGKSAQELNPLIEAGSAKISEYAKEAHDMGYILDNDVIAKNVEAKDAVDTMKNAFAGAKNEIGSAFAPVIKTVAEKVTELVGKIRENKGAVEALGKAVLVAAAAFVAYKTAVAISALLDKLKLAINGAKGAQAALNLVMSANPYALVAAAIAAVTTAIVLFAKKAPTTNARVEEMKAKVDALREKLEAEKKAWDDVMEAQQKMLSEGESENKYYEDLWQELQNIVDENGRVKKGYEDRATFITTTLSEALGKEISLTGGQIKDYQTLRGEINKLIETRKAELVLKASEEAYMTAIKKRDEATATLIQTGKTLEEAQAKWAAADKRRADAKIAYDKALEEADGDVTDTTVGDAAKRYNAIIEEANGLKTQLDNARTAYDQAKEQSAEYTYAIASYEKNLEAAHKGEFEKISAINYQTAKSYTNMSAEEKKAMDNMYGDLAAKAGGLYTQAKKTAESIIQGSTAGLQNKVLRAQANREIGSFGTGLINTLKYVTQVRSPSKATEEIGEYLMEGLTVGIKEEESSVIKKIKSTGKDIVSAFGGISGEGMKMSLQNAKANISAISSGIAQGGGYAGGVNRAVNTTNTANFTQIINSPKPLSRIEIYRDTQNILSLAKLAGSMT